MLPNTSAPSPGNIPGTGYSIGSINTIAELISVVKRFDSDYHPKSSSKVVDEAERPLVMYQTDSQGKEFSSVKPSGETGEPVYLNLQNPVIIDENGTVTNQGANADGQIIKDKDGIRAIVYAAENVKSVAENGIPINGLVNRNTQVDGTYALAGYARDIKDNEYIAIITVEHYSGNIVDSEIIDVGHAIRGRIKNERGPVSQDVKSPKKTIHRDPHSPITIAELLEIVNSTHRGILSKDVLDFFGEERSTEGEYVKEVKFSQLGVDTDNPIYRSGIDEAYTDPIDESVSIDRLPKAEAQSVAEEQNYPVLMREDGSMERAVPGWTWVRASDRGNYGYVSGAKNGMLEVTFVNKANDIRYTPKELFAPGQLTAVDAEYQGEQAPMGEAPPETDRYIPTEEEEAGFETIMQEEEDRQSGKTTTAQQIVAGGELNEDEEKKANMAKPPKILIYQGFSGVLLGMGESVSGAGGGFRTRKIWA